MAGRPYLSVVIPACPQDATPGRRRPAPPGAPTDRLGTALPAIVAYLDRRGLDAEIVVVADGPSDETARAARRLLSGRPCRVLRQTEARGVGDALRRGTLVAAGRWVLFADSGLGVAVEQHAKLAEAARDGDLDLASGRREGSQPSRLARRPVELTIRRATGLAFRDPLSGFKLLDAARLRPIVERTVVSGPGFHVELLFLCRRFGLRVAEVPVAWTAVEQAPARPGAWGLLRDLARIRWRFRRGLYNPETAPRRSRQNQDAEP